MKILEGTWKIVQIVFLTLAGIAIYLVLRSSRRGTAKLDKLQEEAEERKKDELEKMSNSDVVGLLDNANDVRAAGRAGAAKGVNRFYDTAKSLISGLGRSGVLPGDSGGSLPGDNDDL